MTLYGLSPGAAAMGKGGTIDNHDGLHESPAGSAKDASRVFRGRDLRGMTWSGGSLQGTDFSDADLKGARFEGVDLSETRFSRARLAGAVFESCVFRAADFTDAVMTGCEIRVTPASEYLEPVLEMMGVCFRGTRLDRAKLDLPFQEIDLTNADLSEAEIEILPARIPGQGVLLAGSIIDGAHFTIQGIDISELPDFSDGPLFEIDPEGAD